MFISVIIPLYNKSKSVCKTITSVLNQTYTDFEIVVVDDGSTDDSAEYIKKYYDRRIKYIYKENEGVSKARNTGILNADGEWLYFLDADDEIEVDALESFYKLHSLFPNVYYLVGQSKWIQNGIDISVKKDNFVPYVSTTPYFDNWRNRYRTGIRNVLIHKNLVVKYGVFDERMSFYEDWEFPLRLLKCGKVAVTSNIIGIYIQEKNGLSSTTHCVEKDMAYYTQELLVNSSFWYKCLLYSNIEQTKLFWFNNNMILSMYENMQKKFFSKIFYFMHSLRQRMINHNLM